MCPNATLVSGLHVIVVARRPDQYHFRLPVDNVLRPENYVATLYHQAQQRGHSHVWVMRAIATLLLESASRFASPNLSALPALAESLLVSSRTG